MIHFFRLVFLVSVFTFPLLEMPAQLSDNFSDGDFSTDPTWTGSTDNFIVNGDGQLQLNDDEATQSYLSVELSDNSLDNKEWRIWVKQSFSGSANNNSRIYLSSIVENINYTSASAVGAQGYFIQLGEAGSDDAIRLFRDDNSGDSPVEIAAGTVGAISSSFEISIRVLRDNLGNWEIYLDENGGEDYTLEASGLDNTYVTTNYFGMVCKYTVSNTDNFYFDNIYFGDELVDTEAPEIVSVTAISANELGVLFNEPLDESSSENIGSYTVMPFLNPSDAILDTDNNALVHLQFSSDFEENTTLTLQVQDVTDVEGNSTGTITEEFIWFVAPTAQVRDIVFNEIFADPTPSNGLPEGEYVEIYNASDEIFNLENWEFVNTTTSKTLPSFILLPGAYLIICDDENIEQYETFGDVIEIASFTALANSGDSLSLLDDNGTLIDYVVYTDDWYQDAEKEEGGWSLEQINPLLNCRGSNNWSASQNTIGGTPGTENSIFNEAPDTESPELLSVIQITENEINLIFNEALDEASVTIGDFSLSDGIDVENIIFSTNHSIIHLTSDLPFESGMYYTITIQNLRDCEGNQIVEDIVFEFVFGAKPEIGDLIINEIMAAPSSEMPSPNAEFIELYNKSNKLLDLSLITLSGGYFEEQVLIESGAYIIITDPNDIITFLTYPQAKVMQSFPGLTNSGRILELLNADDLQLDYIEYSDNWYGDNSKDDGGWSLELINPNDPCSDGDNWTASNASIGASPGEQNSVHDETVDTNPPSIELIYTIDNQSIELVFNEQIDFSNLETSDVSFELADGSLSDFQVVEIQAGEYPNTLVLLFDMEVISGEIWQVNISGIEDCWGNIAEILNENFAMPEESESGDLIVNEVLFNPKDDGVDFVEIYNNSTKNISLQDWQLANLDNGIMDNLKAISNVQYILFSGEYLVLTKNALVVASQYPFTHSDRILEMETLPTYSNDEGTVFLVQANGEVSDRFDYNDDMHFGLLDNTDGVSLERLDFNRISAEPSNWHSAAQSQNFATPGYLNSQTNTSVISDEEVSISPEVFSPDNDGYQDVVNISYMFDEPGYVANITIFDSEGRGIRQLVRNELLGTSGTYSWDGINEKNELAAIGIYLIYFEIFDLDGNVKGIKTTCVLGHKL